MEELLVGDAIKLTSAEGQADAKDYVWGKYALLFYRPPSPGRRVVALGYHFMWNFTGAVKGRTVKVYREDSRSADVIEVEKYYDQKIVVSDAGTLFSNVVA